MRYILLIILPFLLYGAPFKVATYNVENLFDAVYDGTEYDDYTPGKHNWNARTVEIKLNHTAEVICDLDADVLGLQEIENERILGQLVEKLKKVGCPYKYSAVSHKKGSSIQVALLSRFPIVKQHDIQVSFAPRVRNILEVEVDINGNPLTFFVNHWKSKAYKGDESKRIAYAKALQERISRMPEGKEYIILGDFNSDYNAYMTLEPKNNDTNGKTAFNDVLQTKVGQYLVEESQISKASRGVHFSLWQELEPHKRWSHNFYGKKSSIDQIVLPQQLFDSRGIEYVNNSFGVFKAPYLFTQKGYINRWEYKNKKHTGKGYSDHLPVYAMFDTKAYVAEDKKTDPKQVLKKTVDDLYTVGSLAQPVVLDDVVVVLKRGQNALLKQTSTSRGIFLYGCAGSLEEGRSYDVLVEGISTYKGLKEVTNFSILKEKATVSLESYYLHADDFNAKNLRQNEVVRNLKGEYKVGFLYTEGIKIPLYFKKRKLTPKNGSRLKIDYGHLGYYKKLQLVIYDAGDFEILEE
ncbi:MAG: endonuclease/exonuclease/phosphatase family protein [Sulfurovum sp.]